MIAVRILYRALARRADIHLKPVKSILKGYKGIELDAVAHIRGDFEDIISSGQQVLSYTISIPSPPSCQVGRRIVGCSRPELRRVVDLKAKVGVVAPETPQTVAVRLNLPFQGG